MQWHSRGDTDGVATRANRWARRRPAWVEVRRDLPRGGRVAQAVRRTKGGAASRARQAVRRSSGCAAVPSSTLPSTAKRDPWQRQSQERSAALRRTRQPRWEQRSEPHAACRPRLGRRLSCRADWAARAPRQAARTPSRDPAGGTIADEIGRDLRAELGHLVGGAQRKASRREGRRPRVVTSVDLVGEQHRAEGGARKAALHEPRRHPQA